MSNKLTYAEVKKEFESRNLTLVSTEYINNQTKLDFICNEHPEQGVQKVCLAKLKGGYGCKACRSKIPRKKATVGRTTESLQAELDDIFGGTIQVASEFKATRERIKVRCLKHDYEWEPYVYNLLTGYGCPKCGTDRAADTQRNNGEDVIRRTYDNNGDAFEVLTDPKDIINSKSKVKCRCNTCGTEWETTYTNLTKTIPTRCPKCFIKMNSDGQRKTNEKFLEELKDVNTTVIPIEHWVNYKTPITCTCKIHPQSQWKQSPQTILQGCNGCPKCQPHKREQEMVRILESLGLNIEQQKKFPDCKNIFALPFDAYDTEHNILFEYDGEGHYKVIPRSSHETPEEGQKRLEEVQRHDAIKTNYCKEHDIPLIKIPYWEADDMEFFITTKLKEYGVI